MNTTNTNTNTSMNNNYKTKIKEMKTILSALSSKLEKNNETVRKSIIPIIDDDDCLFTKPLKPFEPELYVSFPKDSLTFNETQIDVRSPEFITQIDYLKEKSVRAAYSRNFCGNA